MSELAESQRNLLELLAKVVANDERGLSFGRTPVFRDLLSQGYDVVVSELATRVRELTDGRLTVSQPPRELLYGYIQGPSLGLVAHSCDLTEVTAREQVQGAWFLCNTALFPAAFDCMPDDFVNYTS